MGLKTVGALRGDVGFEVCAEILVHRIWLTLRA